MLLGFIMRHLPRSVLAALITVYIVWGSTYFAIQVALKDFPPFMLMASRFLVAGVILFAWNLARGARLPNAREWRAATVIGGFMLGGGMGLTAVAQQYVSSGITAVFAACSPMILSSLSGLFGDWPKRREWMGIFAGFAGALLLASGGQFAAQPIGIVILLAAVLCWDIGSVLSQKKLQLAPGGMGFASEMLMGSLFLAAFSVISGESWPATISTSGWIAWAYLVVAGSLLAFTAYMYLLSKVSPGLASSYAYVNPVIAVAIGASLGGEQLSRNEWMATFVILSSVIIITSSATHKKRAELETA